MLQLWANNSTRLSKQTAATILVVFIAPPTALCVFPIQHSNIHSLLFICIDVTLLLHYYYGSEGQYILNNVANTLSYFSLELYEIQYFSSNDHYFIVFFRMVLLVYC